MKHRHHFVPRTDSIVALRDYEDRITNYSYELIGKIREFSGNSMNASAWFNYFSFDVMGDFAFGKSFDMLKTGRMHFAIDWLEESMILLGRFSPISWIVPVGAIAPIVGRNFRRFIVWCCEQAEKRRDTKVEVPDVTSWLLKAAEDRNDIEATKWLHGDSRLIIVAGSDTVAIALTHILYYLAKYPIHVQKLREELDPIMKSDKPFNVRDVQHTQHMSGIINEVLRMHPPVPSGVFRITPPQGITIDGVFVPGGVNVTVPFYAIGRCESHGSKNLPTQPSLLTHKQQNNASSVPTPSSPNAGTPAPNSSRTAAPLRHSRSVSSLPSNPFPHLFLQP